MKVLISEAWRSAISRRLTLFIGVLLSGLFIAAIAAIVARADAEQSVLREQLDAGVSRVLEVRAGQETPFLPLTFTDTVATISGVEYVISASQARDVTVTATQAGPIPMRVLYGHAPGLTLADCEPGDIPTVALSNSTAASHNLGVPVGAVETAIGSQLAIANFVSTPDELGGRVDGAMTHCSETSAATPNDPVVSYIVIESIEQVPPVARALKMIATSIGQGITVVSATELAEYRTSIAGEVSNQRTRGVWLATGSLTALNLIAAAATSILRRSEFGRRRVLGASRGRLGAIVLTEALLVASLSLSIGFGGIVAAQLFFEPWLDLTWLPALATLSVISAIVGQLPAVTVAAVMDPVTVLRVS